VSATTQAAKLSAGNTIPPSNSIEVKNPHKETNCLRLTINISMCSKWDVDPKLALVSGVQPTVKHTN
jgi:hypothetical protein